MAERTPVNISVRRSKPERTGIRAPLGELEREIMQYIWACPHDGCLAVDVQQALERVRPLALTTVLTTLDRLRDKDILRRERTGKAYRYWAMVDEGQLQQRIVDGVMSSLVAQFPKAVAAYFARWEQGDDAQTLDLLAQRVEDAKTDPPEFKSDRPKGT